MPDISMAAARLKPQAWIDEISGIIDRQVGLNTEIRKSWNALKVDQARNGVWHKRVQNEVAIPFNLLHGSWAGTTMVAGKSYKSISSMHARGLANWCKGAIMPGGYSDLYAGFGTTSKATFKGIWLGTQDGRGTHIFKNTADTKSVTLQHNNFEARTTERVWYTSGTDKTIYALSDHVDSTPKGQKALAALVVKVKGWPDSSDRPIQAGFLDAAWVTPQLYVIT